MIYILIELNGFRQLKKVDRILTEQIIEYMTSTFSRDECRFIEQKNTVFFYECFPDEKDHISLFNNLINLFNYLKSIKNDLLGYNILITQDENNYTEELSRKFLQNIFSLQIDESLYISSEVLSLFDTYADFQKEDDFYKLVSFHENKFKNEENIISILSNSIEMDQYLEFLTPLINNDRQGLIFYYGKNVPGISILSFCIAGLIQGKEIDVPWLYIKPDKSKISSIRPFINSMDINFLKLVPSCLDEPELSIWNKKIHFVYNASTIIYEEDAIILFRIYLKAYSRKMAELFMPAIIFILNSHDYDDITLEYMSLIFEDLYLDLDLVIVMFSEEEDIPASFNGFQGKKVSLQSWNLIDDGSISSDSPVSFYHSKMLLKRGQKLLNGPEATMKIIKELEHNSKRFLIIYTLFFDLCEKDEIISYSSVDQSDTHKNENLYNELVLMGLIYPDRRAFPIFENLKIFLSYNLSLDDEVLIDTIVNAVVKQPKANNILAFEKIANIYRQSENYYKEAFYLLEVINLLIITGKTNIAGVFFERIAFILRLNPVEKNTIELKQNIYFLKAAIYDNKDDFASDMYSRISKLEINDPTLDSERKIVCSEYLFAFYKYKKSLDIAKSALIDIQDSDDSQLKMFINLHLARILMGLKRIDESKDYFKIAKETLNRERDLYTLLEINSHEAVVNFIYGNISESLRLVNNSLTICIETGRRDWELFLLFLKGRILFELGNYADAVIEFSEGLRQSDIYFNTANKSIFNIWLGRSYIYLKDFQLGLKILNDFQTFPEALYFSAEALFFKEEFNNAYEKIELAFTLERDRKRFFCSSNILSMESGYDFIEDRSLVVEGEYGVLFQLIRSFRAFLMSKTNKEVEGRLELAKLTREERLSEIDLNNGFYYYLHSLTLPEYTGAEAVDKLTLLSKALRHIQKTASRIDNPKHRQMYLSLNYWNKGLMDEGRRFKLI